LRIADCGLRIADCGLRIADCGLRIADCGLPHNIIEYKRKFFQVLTDKKGSIQMTPVQLKQRTKKFGIRIVKVVEKLPPKRTVQTLGHQLLRSGTSVGAKYRAACRARSNAEFRAKLGICEEEADESIYWLELIIELGYIRPKLLDDLIAEANAILAIVVASIKTSRHRR
jgi:four helix bundle protein